MEVLEAGDYMEVLETTRMYLMLESRWKYGIWRLDGSTGN